MSDKNVIIDKAIRPNDKDAIKGYQPGKETAGHNPGGSNQNQGKNPPSTGSGKTSSTEKK